MAQVSLPLNYSRRTKSFIVGLALNQTLNYRGPFLCPEEPDGPDIAETLMGMGKRVAIEYL